MPIPLVGKPIVITGATAGIGRATAMECARAGMPLVLTGRREDRLRDVVADVERLGGRALPAPGDVTSEKDCEDAVRLCVESFGSVYAVFANAGYGVEAPVHEMSDVEVRDIFETNLFGSLNIIRPALPHMLRARAGHVLFCSSCLAKFVIPNYAAYSATKAAQHHLGRAMRLELAPFGVHASTVHPVGTKTEFFDQVTTRSGGAPIVKHAPDMFLQSPSRVARAVVRCLRSPRPEVWTSALVRYGMAIGGLFPRTSDFFVRKMVSERTTLRANHAAKSQSAAPAR